MMGRWCRTEMLQCRHPKINKPIGNKIRWAHLLGVCEGIGIFADKAAILCYVLYTQQMTKSFTVEYDINNPAVCQPVPKYPVTQGLLIKLL